MQHNNIRLLSVQSRCLDVAHYNHLIDVIDNKAGVLFSAACSLIKSIWDNNSDSNIQIIIDRQGGRTHYRRNLQRMFGELEMTIINESEKMSSYQLSDPKRTMRLHFVTKADQKHLPVSLSSMVSKYVRELLVARINNYFLSHKPDIKPTAGYWKDGLRFIEDIKTHIPHVKYDPTQLIRKR
jgi:ribonuclease HIII